MFQISDLIIERFRYICGMLSFDALVCFSNFMIDLVQYLL